LKGKKERSKTEIGSKSTRLVGRNHSAASFLNPHGRKPKVRGNGGGGTRQFLAELYAPQAKRKEVNATKSHILRRKRNSHDRRIFAYRWKKKSARTEVHLHPPDGGKRRGAKRGVRSAPGHHPIREKGEKKGFPPSQMQLGEKKVI